MTDTIAPAAPAAPVPFDMPPGFASFEARGGWLVQRLAADFSLTLPQAGGIVGNLGFESGGFKELQELRPVAGRGGFGWAQWTASRRVAFEHWCADHDLSPTADEANYGYLVDELRHSYAHCIEQLRKTATVEAAVFTFGFDFERPGGTTENHLPGYAERLHWAQRALAGAVGIHPSLIAAPAPSARPAPPADTSADELNRRELAEITGAAGEAPQPAPAPEVARPAAPVAPTKPAGVVIVPASAGSVPASGVVATMTGAHGATIAGGLSVSLAQSLVWASHWPLQPFDATSSGAVAGLVIAVFGMLAHRSAKQRAANS